MNPNKAEDASDTPERAEGALKEPQQAARLQTTNTLLNPIMGPLGGRAFDVHTHSLQRGTHLAEEQTESFSRHSEFYLEPERHTPDRTANGSGPAARIPQSGFRGQSWTEESKQSPRVHWFILGKQEVKLTMIRFYSQTLQQDPVPPVGWCYSLIIILIPHILVWIVIITFGLLDFCI